MSVKNLVIPEMVRNFVLNISIQKNMQYLVTYIEKGMQKAFYSNWFDVENNFDSEVGMVVFDLINHKYMVNSLGWCDIDFVILF